MEMTEQAGQRAREARVEPNRKRGYRIAKRVLDVLISAVGLVVSSPVLLIAALAIKLEDPHGSVLYRQERVGENGTVFWCHKLRSMYADADERKAELMAQNEMDGPVFKIRNDPRITKVGHFIRKTSIDELPQLWDVLRGDMSLVGPRPLPVAEARGCDAYQRQRELVKPGLTCYWQISGRNDVPFHEWIEMDLEYIRQQSLWTDFKIFLRTIPAVLSGGGLLTRQLYRATKRGFDILISLLGLIATSPVVLLAMLAIVIESPGKPVFLQERIGRDGRTFRMVKLRSMRPDAERMLAELPEEERREFAENFKLRNDPRVTKVGRFIRKTSIDELPQFWNVLKGDMSLVGPRPPLLEEREAYGEHLAKVMSVRPGITGYWQVHGRSDTDYQERIELTEYYIDHCSLMLDLKILLATIPAVLTGGGCDLHYPFARSAEDTERIFYLISKRTFDFSASALASAALLLPMACIALLIVAKDGGNPLYVHARVGRHGKPLRLVKFRSMRRGADDLAHALTAEQLEQYRREYKLDDDPRLLGYQKPGDGARCFGAILRRTSLDELPQILINICLRGDMSIVGPRPILREELERYYTEEQRERLLSVKPGLTGYWQAYARNSAHYEDGERQAMEMHYVEHASASLDLRILLKTIHTLLNRDWAK